MDALLADVRRFGGAAPRRVLRELGHSKPSLKRAVDAGVLRALTRSWVADPDASHTIATALLLRGRVGGATALESYGVWVMHRGETWIAVRPGTTYLPAPEATVRYQCDFREDKTAPWRVSLLDALMQYVRRTERNFAIAAIDSALNLGILSRQDLESLAKKLPRRCKHWLRRVDGRAQSGLETILRLACEDQGWSVRVQVRFQGGRLDLVINGWLCIEVDGSEFHDVGAQARKDRLRNTQLVMADYRWHRFGYADVVYRLGETIDVIRRLLQQGRPKN